MLTERTFDTAQRIYLYDGYQSQKVWKQEENNSTYYNYGIDKQCNVPIRSKELLKQELGINE